MMADRSVLLTTATSLLLLAEETNRWLEGYAVMFIKSEPWLTDLQTSRQETKEKTNKNEKCHKMDQIRQLLRIEQKAIPPRS